MSILLVNIIISLMIGLIAYIFQYYGYRLETGRSPTKHKLYRSPLYFNIFVILYFFLIITSIVITLNVNNRDLAYDMYNSIWMPALMLTVFYPLLLLLLLPLFRRKLLSRSCAGLWLLFPLIIYCQGFGVNDHPLFVIRIPLPEGFSPKQIILPFIWIWSIGFVILLSRNLLSHLLFRRKLLKSAQFVTDEHVLNIMNREAFLIKLPNNYCPVLQSNLTASPLSIGIFRKSVRIILPTNDYGDHELSLIFRHELIHISRRDALLKFILFLFSALFWFNPLMWISRRQCANDLELSCDESVVYGYDTNTHLRYADLLLKTAADERGFTTCLSSRAKAMKYRLKNIISKKRKWIGSGFLSLFLSVFIFISLGCNFTFREITTLEDIISSEENLDNFIITDVIKVKNGQGWTDSIADESLSQLMDHPLIYTAWPPSSSTHYNADHIQIMAWDSENTYVIQIFGSFLSVMIINDVDVISYYEHTFPLSSLY